MYPHYHTHISTSSNTCIHFIEHVFPHYQIRIFVPPFRGCLRICGHDKSVPYSCLWFAITLRTNCQNIANNCQNVANRLLKQFKRITITILTGCCNVADAYKKQKRHVAKNHVPPINLLTLKFLEITLQLLRSLLLKLRIVGIPNRLGYLRGCSWCYATVWIAYCWVVNIPAGIAFIFFHNVFVFIFVVK